MKHLYFIIFVLTVEHWATTGTFLTMKEVYTRSGRLKVFKTQKTFSYLIVFEIVTKSFVSGKMGCARANCAHFRPSKNES
jgi:hypothetical protein